MSLSPEWAGVVGALIGASATLAGNGLTHFLQNRRADNLAEKRRARLVRLLSDKKYTWRSIEVLASSIGASEEDTLELLIEIDARKSLTNDKSWALVSRAPWPDDVQKGNE